MNLYNYLEQLQKDKILIVLRGLPGSGKSYTAKQIQSELGGQIFSTDEKFMVDGEYKFNVADLGKNHKLTQEDVQKAVDAGVSPIIVDNTNIKLIQNLKFLDFHLDAIRILLIKSHLPIAEL